MILTNELGKQRLQMAAGPFLNDDACALQLRCAPIGHHLDFQEFRCPAATPRNIPQNMNLVTLYIRTKQTLVQISQNKDYNFVRSLLRRMRLQLHFLM